ncbi:MAG: gliding motility-associated C-terminal domain-containing protein [Flavobacteriales bacterium]|nr:gliding motility-associated C-terminal domain-containing protein [Flavobacteriales bacterium]
MVTFSNTDGNAHNTWDSGNNWNTALTKDVEVSGLPASGMVLRQINLSLGSTSGSNISTLAARLTDPQGNIINVFNAGYFYDTDFSRFVSIKLRDHAQLKRLNDYTNSYLGMPYSFGYYRVETPGSFASLNTTDAANGTWTFAMIEATGTEIQFNSVELVFGPAFNYVDITGGTDNSACAQAQCTQSGADQVLLATNVAYPQNQPNFPPLTLNGCNWNAEPNNTAWFYFVASEPTVSLSVSGFNNNVQQTLVLRNDGTCDAPAYTQVACPLSMFVNNCNTTTGDQFLYHRLCYDGGSKFNHGYTITGLVPGQEYVLLVDGQSAANTTFYLEIASGADNACAPVVEVPEITDVVVENSGCGNDSGSITITATGTDLQYSIDGGTTFQTDNTFTGLAAGSYTVVVINGEGESDSAVVEVLAAEVPVIDGVTTVQPACGAADGSITVTASGTDLQYSIDGGTTLQIDPFFGGLVAGSYAVLVINADGCTATTAVDLSSSNAPVIDQVLSVDPLCSGDANGSIEVQATGAAPLQYSLDGVVFQASATFTGLAAGNYTVVVQDAAGCTASTQVVLNDPAPIDLTNVEISDESCANLCDGIVNVVGTGGVLFSLDGGTPQASPFFSELCPATYTLQVSNANGCTASAPFVVGPGANIAASFTADPLVVVGAGTPVTLTNTSVDAATYLWTFGSFGISFEENPVFTFPDGVESVQVCLQASSIQGCLDTACVLITRSDIGDLELPNVFTPNGDGVNDGFGVFGNTTGITDFSLEVRNRYGQVIFLADRVGMVWDGRQFAGEQVPEGTYFYVLNYTQAGTAESRTGHVTLVR